MKFMHLADVHLGLVPDKNRSWSQKRKTEIYETFKRAIRDCSEKKVDLALIAGDLFHGQPLLSDLKEVNYLLEKASPVQFVIIAGNHDYIRDNSYYRNFIWAKNVHFIQEREMTCVKLKNLNTYVYGLSYHTKEIYDNLYESISISDRQGINILLGHGGDEKHIPFVETTFKDMGFDYAAFGHIHKRYQSLENRFAYSGSLEPTDKNDFGKKGYILGEIDERTRKLTLEFVPCAQRQYISFKIIVNESVTNNALSEKIEQKILENGRKNIYRIILSGIRHESIEFSLENELRQYCISDIVDETQVDYDYDKIYEDNMRNIVGKVIKTLRNTDEKAMFYAVNALLKTKR